MFRSLRSLEPHPRRVIYFGLWLAGLMFINGCSLLEEHDGAEYETISSGPVHDTEEAIEQHDKALKIIARYLDGEHHHSNLNKAEEHLQAALVADVTYGPAHNTLGMLYYWRRKLYLAAWEYEYAVKLMPDQAEPLYNLGMVYESARNMGQAITYYEMAYHLEPQNPYVIGNLARARVKSGAPVDVVRNLLQALILYDERPGWITWAERQLALNPHQFAGYDEACEEEPPVIWNGETENSEETDGPYLPPPAPPAFGDAPESAEPQQSDAESPGILRLPPDPEPEPETESEQDATTDSPDDEFEFQFEPIPEPTPELDQQ